MQAEYDRLINKWLANGRRFSRRPSEGGGTDLTVAEILEALWRHTELHYRHPDGTQKGELRDDQLTLRPLNHRSGQLRAKNFGPLALKAVRQVMIDGYTHPKYGEQQPPARRLVHQRIGRILSVFKWAVSNELIPATGKGA